MFQLLHYPSLYTVNGSKQVLNNEPTNQLNSESASTMEHIKPKVNELNLVSGGLQEARDSEVLRLKFLVYLLFAKY